jgi:D-glycero-alpha-D-manno-heptose 1-phosphate guanylyltransferase
MKNPKASRFPGRGLEGSAVSDVTAALLVGGKGTRLRSVVPSTPKPLAQVGGKSFLELLVSQLQSQGFRRLVMCTGYLADQIESEFGNGDEWGVAIQYSREQQALGTAGALKLAQPFLQQAPSFLVMNGDSFLEIDFDELIRFHRGHGGIASIAVQRVDDASRYGAVHMAAHGRVTGFGEKSNAGGAGLVNAGVYVFERAIFECIPEGPASLEREVFPAILGRGVYALEQRGMFIDIGIPEDYARAQAVCEQLRHAASGTPQRKAQSSVGDR